LHIFFPIINYLEFGICVCVCVYIYQQYVLINYVK